MLSSFELPILTDEIDTSQLMFPVENAVFYEFHRNIVNSPDETFYDVRDITLSSPADSWFLILKNGELLTYFKLPQDGVATFTRKTCIEDETCTSVICTQGYPRLESGFTSMYVAVISGGVPTIHYSNERVVLQGVKMIEYEKFSPDDEFALWYGAGAARCGRYNEGFPYLMNHSA